MTEAMSASKIRVGDRVKLLPWERITRLAYPDMPKERRFRLAAIKYDPENGIYVPMLKDYHDRHQTVATVTKLQGCRAWLNFNDGLHAVPVLIAFIKKVE
ncbi:hypothetical protein FWF48_02335 [Candidatus Saccharibacteria bacterium]|nr:hypothetical protein [Candidatus Saccharibacteria bacterium]